MICPFCNKGDTRVTNSRKHMKASSVWRRRNCTSCKAIFSTNEEFAPQSGVLVRKPDKSRQDYNKARLLIDILSCFDHDKKKGLEAAWWLTNSIETKVLRTATVKGQKIVITSQDIKLIALDTLEKYDRSSAVQYAAKHGVL